MCTPLPWSLPPAMKLGQGYVFTRVCDSVHKGGFASVHAGIQPPGADPPGANTPRSRHLPPPPSRPPLGAVHSGRYEQQAGGTHPTGMHTCLKYADI